MKKILLILILLFCNTIAALAYYDSNRVIRVGISDTSFNRYKFKNASFTSNSKFKVVDVATFKELGSFDANTAITVSIKNGVFDVLKEDKSILKDQEREIIGPLSIESDSSLITALDTLRKSKPAIYKGRIELVKSLGDSNFFAIVNHIDIETYLKGVVPNEMPIRFGLEALKVQAVAARNYALMPRSTNYKEFDICDSQACQVYFGAGTESDLSNKAIAETRGIMALHNDIPILALYSSTAGGYTESYENAFNKSGTKTFPASPLPYLKGAPDNPLTPVLDNEKDAREFYLSYPETFDNNSPFFRWQRQWQVLELEQTLKENLKSMYPQGYIYPKLGPDFDFGDLKDIKVLKRGVSGKIVELEIVGSKNTFLVQKELVVRRLFKKNKQALPSANVIFDLEKSPGGDAILGITAYGGGFGHGVGMSQFGAGYMSAKGFSFDQILKRYYPNITLATEPITLKANFDENSAMHSFFTKSQHVHLVIEHKFTFADLTMNLNGVEKKVHLTPTLSLNKRLSYDITEYIKLGANKITYYLEPDKNETKTIRVFVELQ